MKKSSDISAYKRLIKDSEVDGDSESNWLITLSDVLTLLLVFFIMFAFLSKKTNKTEASPTGKESSMPVAQADIKTGDSDTIDKVKHEMDNAVRDLNLEEDVDVRSAGNELVVTMKEKAAFRSAEADLIKESEPVLDKIASVIISNPSFIVEIDGHTDNRPISTSRYPSNWELSVARSASVLKYFINRHGIEPSRLSIKGNADHKPLAANDTEEHRAQNRRVEIRMKETEA
jgi:chemotaxis protein MotB